MMMAAAAAAELRSFIAEQQGWLDRLLDAFGWTRQSLKNGQPRLLMQCPYNGNHYIAKTSIEGHRARCQYGLEEDISDNELTEEERNNSTFVGISSSIIEAVKKYSASATSTTEKVSAPQPRQWDKIDQSEVVVESHDHPRSLESQSPTQPDILAQGHLHIIRYIKAWPVVPADFINLSSSSLNPVEVKAWLFNNLPEKHSFSTQLGGEIEAVETVIRALTSQSSITPDTLVSKLSSIFGQRTRLFVLSLWKFIHTAILQKQHTILSSEVEELTPLPPSRVAFLKNQETSAKEEEMEVDSFANKIQALAESESPRSPLPQLPMSTMQRILNPTERLLLYDYIIEVGGKVPGSGAKDPGLFRDDAAAIKAKLKQQAREESLREGGGGGEGDEGREGRGKGVSLYQMKKERDYRRRRQKYRARNVHITQRTPSQVMRDIINARMLEIASQISSNIGESSSSLTQFEGSNRILESEKQSRETAEPSTKLSEKEEWVKRRDSKLTYRGSERESNTREKARRSRSHEKSRRSHRSRSRERSKKKHSHRSRSGERKRERSPSAGRGRSRERGRRSRSTSRSRHHSHGREHHKKKKSKEKKK